MSTQQQTVARASVVMFLYAALILTFGILAYLIAPPGANAKTAVVVTGLCALVMLAMGVMSMMVHKKRKIGMIGIHLGLILPLVFAVVFLMRAGASYRSSGVYQYFDHAYQVDIKGRQAADTPANRESFLSGAKPESGRDLPAGDKGYLGFILTMLFGVSVAAFVVLLLSRPELPPKPAPVAVAPEEKPTKAASTGSKESVDAGGFD